MAVKPYGEPRKPNYILTLLLFLLAVVLVAQGQWQKNSTRNSLVYRESLDEVAARVNGVPLTLRDVAFYVAYEEELVEQQALTYDSEHPEYYWRARVKGGFVWAVARDAVIQMAIHDELFYQMAVEDGMELTEEDEQEVEQKLDDFWSDLTDRSGEEKLGVTREEVWETLRHIALAEKYQEIFAELNNRTCEDYDVTADVYTAYLEEQDYTIENSVWGRVGVGSITLDHSGE